MVLRRKKKIKEIRNRRDVPLGVKIISILMFIMVAVFVILGIILAILGVAVTANHIKINNLPADFPSQLIPTVTGDWLGLLLTVVSFIIILFALIEYIIALNFIRLKNWARIIVIVISILWAISALVDIFQGKFSSSVSFVLYVVIAAYLISSKEVKKAFR